MGKAPGQTLPELVGRRRPSEPRLTNANEHAQAPGRVVAGHTSWKPSKPNAVVTVSGREHLEISASRKQKVAKLAAAAANAAAAASL
ncbi:hypothetical protein AGOR_G00040840 [Albula goreensis]|uniref:Uncharacterized protein n=1 Tax=Albula goreensis TaxID=1534307 RepID=A0A8T3DYH0_9TELE|nr:hypothetical protein AGOR_G00040840 [Albula goreensis]